MSVLPLGWTTASLGDLAEYLNGAAFKPADWHQTGKPIIRIQNLTDSSKPFNRTECQLDSKYLVDGGDILVSWSATLDAFIWDGEQSWLNQHIFKVIPFDGIDQWFLFYLLKHEILALIETEHLHGSTMKHINRGPFLAHEIALPPLAEQRRIVAKLDALFARTRQAREELEHIPALIEHYKQAILAAAFRGELTADWRAKHQPPQVHANISGIDGRTGQLPGIPDVWGWASIDSISQVSGGLTKNAQRRELKKKVPYLRVANVYANELRLDEVKEIGCTDSELAKTQLQQGDLLVVEGNGSIEQIGRVAIWDGSITPCSHQNHIIRVRPNEQVISPYILFWMISPLGRQYIERVASSSSGLHTLSISKVSGLAIPVCSIDEQKEVVRHIEEAFTWLDTVLDEATAAMHLLDHLDEATLAKAFRGELVPQDPKDEPASVLLERIREARAEQSNGGKGKKRK